MRECQNSNNAGCARLCRLPKQESPICEGVARPKQKRAESPMFSIAQGNALGIRYLRTLAPCKGSSNNPLFLQLPLQGALFIECYIPRAMPWAMENIGLSARFYLSFDTPSNG